MPQPSHIVKYLCIGFFSESEVVIIWRICYTLLNVFVLKPYYITYKLLFLPFILIPWDKSTDLEYCIWSIPESQMFKPVMLNHIVSLSANISLSLWFWHMYVQMQLLVCLLDNIFIMTYWNLLIGGNKHKNITNINVLFFFCKDIGFCCSLCF